MKTKGLDNFQLKILMAFLMVFDHLYIIPGLLSDEWISIFHALTRCVAVWFAFAAVEGFIYTRNRLNYVSRLFIWATIMFVGNTIFDWFFQSKEIHIGNNIFLTLACGVLMLILFYGVSNDKTRFYVQYKLPRLILGIVLSVMAILWTEGGSIVIPFMLITYACRDKKLLRNFLYCTLSLILFCSSIQIYQTWNETLMMMFYNSDWLFITVLPLITLYNGKRGLATRWSKYFFYVFYPAHLWLLACIGYFIQK
ncbi:MAG: TraX family protein [Streptococcus sp.]|nr:TraX family protein [Streptococcus sp.]